ncbi:MAG: hypothetical protein ACLRVQ_03490 [Lachnospiraceae bacterium]
MRDNYNKSKNPDAKVPQCPPEKEKYIVEALKHFQMIYICKNQRRYESGTV